MGPFPLFWCAVVGETASKQQWETRTVPPVRAFGACAAEERVMDTAAPQS